MPCLTQFGYFFADQEFYSELLHTYSFNFAQLTKRLANPKLKPLSPNYFDLMSKVLEHFCFGTYCVLMEICFVPTFYTSIVSNIFFFHYLL